MVSEENASMARPSTRSQDGVPPSTNDNNSDIPPDVTSAPLAQPVPTIVEKLLLDPDLSFMMKSKLNLQELKPSFQLKNREPVITISTMMSPALSSSAPVTIPVLFSCLLSSMVAITNRGNVEL
uniref:Uncharacterized protein n=1 Tax=Cannabis sativa TaxID=3483 RepID=A0A803P5U3_CANSA